MSFAYCNNLKTIYYNAINCEYKDYRDGMYVYPLFYQVGVSNTSTEQIIIGNSVENIPEGIFSSINNMTEINIPDSVKTIEDNAFYMCKNVTKLNLGNGIEEIGNYSFAYLNISKLTIPQNVKSIGSYAFYSCTNLNEVIVKKSSGSISGAPWTNVSGVTVKWEP
jgi:hypothetical protein